VLPPLQYSALGFETFADDVLRPSIPIVRIPLQAAIWQPRDSDASPENAADRRRDAAQARRQGRFREVPLGHRWGPVWSTAWFRLVGRVDGACKGQRVWLRFSSGTEATLWDGDEPRQGFDPYRDLTPILEKSKGNEKVDLLVEAACNLPLGISTFWWDHPELHARWKEREPGRLESAELVVVDDEAWQFVETWSNLRKTLLALPPESARAVAIREGMRRIMASIDRANPRGGMRRSMDSLARLVVGAGPSTRTTCVAVGHAHIDTAWLWPLAETRRKCIRTFANVLRLMERFPDFRFVCSQAQQYAWIEEDAPKLFAQIAKRVNEGRWETAGAMWIEPDCTCPSGESFIRQILHGTRYWSERFGAAATQRFLYLPDTFGFPACLPQIGRLAGLDTFITNKMSWCESNRFPHVTFRWRGLDGTEILSHLTPGHNYNSSIEPADLLYGEKNLVTQDGASFVGSSIPLWLQPFGFGDGGGGPTAEQVFRASSLGSCEGLPRVVWDRVDRFAGQLHAVRDLMRADRDLATWDGELYLELHRGTYTSQAWIKRQNRLAESLLRDVEALVSSLQASAAERRAVRERLDGAWKLVLLNQFHDILPGSSIGAVYDDARRQHAEVADLAMAERTRLERELAKRLAPGDCERPVLVRNAASSVRSGIVSVDGRLVEADAVPAMGFAVIDARRADASRRVHVERGKGPSVRIRNEWLEATIDAAGRIGELRVHGLDRVANARLRNGELRPLNQLAVYDDQPRRWEAWDIDRDYADRESLVTTPAEISVVCEDPLRAEVRVQRRVGRRSELFQTYRLDAGTKHLEIRTEVRWDEERTLLRALFPCDVRAPYATFGTQFGAIERPTHRNTSWEEARYEVPGHAWMDLSEPGFGVAILDDGKYGRSALDNVLGLSLLRAPSFPDPAADRGEHVFTYAVMLHDGDWRGAGVDAEAEALREPLRAVAMPARRRAASARRGVRVTGAPFRIEAPSHCFMQVAAWKPAEDGKGRILRIVETRGGRGEVAIRWADGAGAVTAADVLERPMRLTDEFAPSAFVHDTERGETTFRVRPFQIVTLRVADA
jgi:alpha-mannosidase